MMRSANPFTLQDALRLDLGVGYPPQRPHGDGDDGGGDGGDGGDAGAGDGKSGDGAKNGDGAGDGGSSGDEGVGGSELAKLRADLEAKEKVLAKRSQELKAANAEAAERRKLLEKYGGMTPEQIQELMTFKEQQEQTDRERRGQYEEQLQLERKKLTDLQGEKAKVESDLERTIIHNAILSGASVNDPLDQALSMVNGRAQIVAVTEDLFEYDREHRRVVHKSERDEGGDPMTPAVFFARERTKSLANMFRAGLKNGAGVPGGESGGERSKITISRSKPDWLNDYEKAKKDGVPFDIVP